MTQITKIQPETTTTQEAVNQIQAIATFNPDLARAEAQDRLFAFLRKLAGRKDHLGQDALILLKLEEIGPFGKG